MLAYVVGEFPALTQTFVLREIHELARQGLEPRVWYLGRARHRLRLPAEDEALLARSRYVSPAWSPGTWWAAAARFRSDPARARAALATLRGLPWPGARHRAGASLAWLRAAAVAGELEAAGVRHVHAHFATTQTAFALALSELLQVPFSFTAHAQDIYANASCLPEKMARAAFVVTCTAYNGEYLRAQAPSLAGRIHVLRHGVPASAAPGPAPLPPPAANRPLRLLAVGRLIAKKGYPVLLEALRQLEPPRPRLRVLGEGPERAALEAAARGLEVELVGAVPPDAVPAELAAADVLVAPSVIAASGDRDGIPNAIVEAMAAGLPVVATATSGIPEAIEHEVSGLLVEPGNPAALAAAIARLGADPELRARLGRAARARALAEFDLATNVARLAALFRAQRGLEATGSVPR